MQVQSAVFSIALFLVGIHGAVADAYIGLDGSSLSIENSQDSDLSPRGVRLRLGARISQVLDIELHLGGGSESETVVADRLSAGYLGGFVKAYAPLGERSALFALAGVSSVEFTQTVNGREFSDDRSGFSFGFGMETQLTQRLDLSADFVRYLRSDGPFTELSSVNLGIKYYF